MASVPPVPVPGEATPELASAVTQLVARAAAVDGVGPLNEEALLGLRRPDPHRSHWTLSTPTTGLVGYATIASAGGRATGQLVVDPAHRRHGYGTALADAAEQGIDGSSISWWAFGDTAAAQALAARRGLAPVRQLLKLARPLAALPAPRAVPSSARLRTFRPGADDAALLAVNARAFASHPEQGAMSQTDLDARFAEEWFDPQDLLLAVDPTDDTRVLGFHWMKLSPSKGDDPLGPPTRADNPTPQESEVYVLGVDPDAHGGGLGGALLDAGLAHLAERGATTVDLYVEGDNTAALGLYTRAGFAEISRDVMYA